MTQAENGEQALAKLSEFAFDVLITDLRLPGADGTQVLEAAIERYPKIIGIVVTGYGTVKGAVEAIKIGAADYIQKPIHFDGLLFRLKAALEQQRLKSENVYLRSQLEERYRFEGLVGHSQVMRELFQLLEIVSPTNSTVLITGETGTGKELVARAIHHNSPRRTHRFAALNCSAIPETMLEAELFGHVRGAFTGAAESRPGRLEQAHKGTLFLDEVTTMSSALQAKLLRVLQERELERIGGTRQVKIDVRIVAATNSDLAQHVAEGTFRKDLFYRLNVIPISLPALRDRREDIPFLAQHFLERFSRNLHPPRAPVELSQEATRQLMAYDWPGNVRQLENLVERMLTFSQGRSQIKVADLPPEVRTATNPVVNMQVKFPDDGIDFRRYVHDVEREIIRQALQKSGGNKRQAADLLLLKRTTLIEKIKRLQA